MRNSQGNENHKNIMTSEPVGKRPLGRQRDSWEYNIKMGFK
jgi:hypothetical protein